MDVLFINGKRNGYAVEQCGSTLGVIDLIEILESFDPDLPVYLRNDNGYTYGSILDDDIYCNEENEED